MAEYLRQLFVDFWIYGLAIAGFLFELGCAIHAVMRKRDVRSTITWIGLIWLTPLVGAVFYVLFGVNRIQRRAKHLRRRHSYVKSASTQTAVNGGEFERRLGDRHDHWRPLVELVDKLAEQPLLAGNRIDPLWNGDQAYPAMLGAIDGAQRTITLCTYIFDRDLAGMKFVAALGSAVARGVDVRVIIDDTGSRYSFPSIIGSLRSVGCRVERFNPSLWPRGFAYSNLRTHRKIMVVDGAVGFTGGMNIRVGCWHGLNPHNRFDDLHFRCTGPVVSQLQEAFAEDWKFVTDEVLDGEAWFVPLETIGPVLARGIPTGPDEDLGELRTTIIGALANARERVLIVTPYFLPDETLIEALNVTALRGVRVEILLPVKNNLRLVDWAMQATLPLVLERGCQVYRAPGRFAHSKFMVVDGLWTLIGSANWDPRSLRLNFEFNVECYDALLGAEMTAWFDNQVATLSPLTIEDLDKRGWLIKLRNGLARLLSPIL